MESEIVPIRKVCLIVIDEAHRATGNYAYCKIIEFLEKQGAGFRIVALSATPVSKIENLQTIVQSLRVCKFEVRDEDLTNFTERKDTEEDDSDDLDNNCTNPFLGE